MWSDRVSSPGPLALESDALKTALRGPPNLSLTCRNDMNLGAVEL